MGSVIAFKKEHSGREDGAVVLLPDNIAEDDGAVAGNVAANVLVTGVGIASVIDYVTGIHL